MNRCSQKCVFDDRHQLLCTSPERVSEPFSNQFWFSQVDFGAVLFEKAAFFKVGFGWVVEAESGRVGRSAK